MRSYLWAPNGLEKIEFPSNSNIPDVAVKREVEREATLKIRKDNWRILCCVFNKPVEEILLPIIIGSAALALLNIIFWVTSEEEHGMNFHILKNRCGNNETKYLPIDERIQKIEIEDLHTYCSEILPQLGVPPEKLVTPVPEKRRGLWLL